MLYNMFQYLFHHIITVAYYIKQRKIGRKVFLFKKYRIFSLGFRSLIRILIRITNKDKDSIRITIKDKDYDPDLIYGNSSISM